MSKRKIAAFCVYIFLAASGWILELVYPTSLPASEAQFLICLFVVASAVLPGRRKGAIEARPVIQALVSGLLLLGVPTILFVGSHVVVPALTRVALLALVPVVVVGISATREVGDTRFLSLLGAALAGVAGALLLLPADLMLLLERPLSGVLFAAAVLSISAGSYLGHVAARAMPLRNSVIFLISPSLLVVGLTSFFDRMTFVAPTIGSLPGLIWGSAELLLLIFLLRALPPTSFATRYFAIPVLTALEGFAYLRPAITWRMLLGWALLIFGSMSLLRRARRLPDSSMSLL